MTEVIGYLAAILTTACYVPQALHVFRTKHTAGISLHAYSLLFAGVTCWAIYGLLKMDWPLMLANGISILLIGAILAMKLRLG